MGLLKRGMLLTWLILLALALPLGTAAAQSKTIKWQRYDVTIQVMPNGDLFVIETQEIEFVGGPFTTGFAVIPLTRTDGISDIHVLEGTRDYLAFGTRSYSYTYSDDGANMTVEWTFPPSTNETRTFQLLYTVHGAVRRYDTGDKIQFLALSRELEFPVENSRITVLLPPGGEVIQDPDSAGALVEWAVSDDKLGVTYDAVNGVAPYEGIEIGVAFKHGAVSGAPPSWQAAYDRQFEYEENIKPWVDLGLGALAMALLLAAPAGLYLIWYTFGRDPSAGLVPEFVTEPPSDLPPGLAGTLIDERADLRDLTATMIDFARRGHVTLEEQELPGSFGMTRKSFVLKKSGAPESLRRYEKMLYDAVFGVQDTRDLSAMPERFFSKLPGIESALYDEAVKEGLFKAHPENVRSGYQALGVVILIVGVVLGVIAAIMGEGFSSTIACPFGAMVVFGLGLTFLSRAMPAKTNKGAEQTALWKAFHKYLGNIQKYGDIESVGEQFEKYLPYAIAFGLERRWVSAFANAPATLVPIPTWYRPYRMRVAPAGGQMGKPSTAPAGGAPNLNDIGQSAVGGLNSIGDGLISALNTAGKSFATPPASMSGGNYRGGGRGLSGGGSFRSGGGFRGGGFSGGGSRGFR